MMARLKKVKKKKEKENLECLKHSNKFDFKSTNL